MPFQRPLFSLLPPPPPRTAAPPGLGGLRTGLATGSAGSHQPSGTEEWCGECPRFLLPSPPLRRAPGARFVYLHSPLGSPWSHPASWQPLILRSRAELFSSPPHPRARGVLVGRLETGLRPEEGISVRSNPLSPRPNMERNILSWFLLDLGAIYGTGRG